MSRNDLFTSNWSATPPPTRSTPPKRPPPIKVTDNLPLSPLHQSPTLAVDAWKPPLPPFEDVELRLVPSDTYLLGEGRYGRVYLASYRKGKGKEPVRDVVNDKADGFVGGSWRLCAAKRMAPDRQSQTMGLREAFFLNRLNTGSVYIVKLFAVKEGVERRHGRSVSDVRDDTSLGGLSLSRLTLLLEHAPLGTLDRMLRTSPALVTHDMWTKWARQSTEAIAWCHAKGVVHADVKPANLLLTSNLDLRLSDFGSSLLVHPDHPPTDGVGLGTLPFSSPELVNLEPFSFPVDIFALAASLYQCITGKEPYKGLRSVEIMHHVRKGNLWAHEERQRLHRVGNELGGSPYPSAWRDEGLQRGGSLRVRPKLSRMPSAESLRASDDIVAAQSPSGIKIWARWAHSQPRADAVSALLAEEDLILSPLRPETTPRTEPPSPIPNEGGVMTFLSGEIVPETIRDTLHQMLSPDPSNRPTAKQLEW